MLLALILLAAAFMLSGCVSSVEIEGASLDSAPTSGTLVFHVQKNSENVTPPMPESVKIKEGSTITLKRMDGSTEDVVLSNPKIEKTNKKTGTMDICFAYDGLKPGKYQIAANAWGYIEGLVITVQLEDEKEPHDRDVLFLDEGEGASKYAITVVPSPKPTAVPDTSNLPKTGDGSSPALWLIVCLGCAAAVALLLRKRSRR